MIQTMKMAAPKPRERQSRLTDELKSMAVDAEHGVRLDNRTANCLREYGRNNGWTVVGHKDGVEHQILWRVG